MNKKINKARIAGVILLLAALLCAMPVSQAEKASYEGPGWNTPEEAVQVYLEGVKEQSLQKMISAYAVETYVDSYDMAAQLARTASYTLSMVPRTPSATSLLRDMNIEARKNEIVQAAFWQMFAVCLPDQDYTQPTGFTGEGREAEAAAFVEGMDTAFGAVDFSTLEIVRFIPPEEIAEVYASEANQDNLMAQGAPYGADEVRSVAPLFIVDGKLGVLCCDAMRYGDQWYLFRSGGNIGTLAGITPYSGGMVATDIAEIEELREALSAEDQEKLDTLLAETLPLL